MRFFKVSLACLFVAFIVMQFFPGARTNPPLIAEIQAPPEVQVILEKACYDCHSNETRWPWYSHVAPVSWLVSHDVKEARDSINFSEWESYKPSTKNRMKGDMWDEVEKGKMPLWYYVLLHPQAKLSEAEKQILYKWTNEDSPSSLK